MWVCGSVEDYATVVIGVSLATITATLAIAVVTLGVVLAYELIKDRRK